MRKRRKIKQLRRKKFLNRSAKKQINNIIKVTSFIMIVFLIGKITFKMRNLYEGIDIELSKIDFYVSVADEVSKGKAQVNWQELLAIDLVKYNGNLSNIRKIDVIENGKRFIVKSKESYTGYAIKPIEKVLEELRIDTQDRQRVYKELDGLKYVSISGIDLSKEGKYGRFIDELSERAIKNYEEYEIFPSITVGQAILESGWGESDLTKESNNLFGIKADNRWDGESVRVNTGENYNDTVVASFRAYNSRSDSLEDHAQFLSSNKRYTEHGVFSASDYKEQAQALENAGYSTKENEKGEKVYADILIDVIIKYNLQLLDHKAQVLK
ncbi:MAG: glycoside hydrolase family 73 protein [Paraclostridium sp.]